MTSEIVLTPSPAPVQSTAAETVKRARVWPAVVLIGLYWTYYHVMAHVEAATVVRLLS